MKKGMKKLSMEAVKHVAKLANLPLSDEEINIFTPQLSEIVEFVSRLQSVDTFKVEATSQVTGQVNVYREDIVDTSRMFSQDNALANAKEKHSGFFVIPAIFE